MFRPPNKAYDYDAFGNEKDPDPLDTNPFRYCGEYLDAETGSYYLRARYYDPTIGRFTQQDTHWNTANMIYGDNPQKINEREDKLGLKTYTHVPQITAVMQSGVLYVYCGNNPVLYEDSSGYVWDTIFDVVSLCFSVADVAANPTDVWSWVSLAGDVIDLIPFVSGVGESTKVIGATIRITNKADDVTDTIKIVKATDFTDDALDTIKKLDKVDGATKSTMLAGSRIHKGYKTDYRDTSKWKKEMAMGRKKIDFMDKEKNTIYELKPMNVNGLKNGIRQLKKYQKAIGKRSGMVLELY